MQIKLMQEFEKYKNSDFFPYISETKETEELCKRIKEKLIIIDDNQLNSFLNKLEQKIMYSYEFAESRMCYINIIFEFIKYLNDTIIKKQQLKKIDPYIDKYDLKKIRDRELIKALQTNNEKKYLADLLNMSLNAKHIDKMINEIPSKGIDIYGNLVKLKTQSSNSNRGYRTETFDSSEVNDVVRSVNPIGLALNHIEVFVLLVVVLKSIDPNSTYYETYRNIACKIYTQLSENARKMVDKNLQDEILEYVNLEYYHPDIRNKLSDDFINVAAKSGWKVKVTYLDDNQENCTKTGVIDCDSMFSNNLILKTDSTKIFIDYKNIISLIKI